MLNEPARSPYDWEFFLFGFSVRVTWLFWLISAAWGYHWAQGLHELYEQLQLETPGLAPLLAIWIGASLVSILIHELGHAVVMRWYGIPSYIVLYHFGGLAIPSGGGIGRRRRRESLESLWISAAGPVFQLVFGIAVALVASMFGIPVGSVGFLLDWLPLPTAEWPSNAAVMGLVEATVYTSFFWALLNLLPVLPLDGGHIAQSLLGRFQGNSGFREATILSIVVSALVALYGFRTHDPTLGMFFLIFAMQNLQALQHDSYLY